MVIELTDAETMLVLSALATEQARFTDLARRQLAYPNLARTALIKSGAIHDLRVRVRDLMRRSGAARRTRRVGARFGCKKITEAT